MSHAAPPQPSPSAFNPFAEPTRNVPAKWIAFFAIAWFGIWMAQLTPVQLLLPIQIDHTLRPDGEIAPADWLESVRAFGIISGIAGVCALIAYPLTGFLSDRTTSKLGRRRPWILAGAIIFAVALIVLGLQTNIIGIGICWSVAIIGFCMVSAAITATISDQVPVDQRGIVSGWVSAPQAVGTVLGIVLVTMVIEEVITDYALSRVVGYASVAVLLVLLVLPFFFGTKDEVLPKVLRPKFSFGGMVRGFWINPVKHPDFGWTLLSRILVNIGNALGTTLLIYFIMFGLGRIDTAEDDLLGLTIVYLITFIIAALGMGRLSDAIHRRKPFVYAAAYLQGIAALLLALVPDLSVAFIGAGLLGLGYGCFMAVDQALATQVLPSQFTRGKDLGIMNIATAVPQAFGPLLGALIVVSLGGFVALFIASAVFAVLGALSVVPVKSVR